MLNSEPPTFRTQVNPAFVERIVSEHCPTAWSRSEGLVDMCHAALAAKSVNVTYAAATVFSDSQRTIAVVEIRFRDQSVAHYFLEINELMTPGSPSDIAANVCAEYLDVPSWALRTDILRLVSEVTPA